MCKSTNKLIGLVPQMNAKLLLLTQKPTVRYTVCCQLSGCSLLGTVASDGYFSVIGVHYEVEHS
jgi:hypothetical protein